MQAHLFVFLSYFLYVYVQFLQLRTMISLYLANIVIRKVAHEIYYEGKGNIFTISKLKHKMVLNYSVLRLWAMDTSTVHFTWNAENIKTWFWWLCFFFHFIRCKALLTDLLPRSPSPVCLALFHCQHPDTLTQPHAVWGLAPVGHQPRLYSLHILPMTYLNICKPGSAGQSL